MAKLTKIYYVRHGESEGNVGAKNDHAVGVGSNLTEKGIVQAKKRAETLKNIKIDAIFSSTLSRAIQTAEIIKLQRDVAVQATELIRERNIAPYLKDHPEKTREILEGEILKSIATLGDKAKLAYKHADNLESPEEGASRILTFLREVAIAYPEKTVLVVGHGNTMRSTLTHLGWATYDELPMNAIENTGYVVLESDGTDFFINETQGITKYPNSKRGW